MERWMDGRTGGGMDGWMDGRMNEWMDGCVVRLLLRYCIVILAFLLDQRKEESC
jgi:hypothetical protein